MAGSKHEAWMVLKVDLSCSDCYKNVQKILAKFPEIHDRLYEEKTNVVKIKVVCCWPEKLRDKLYRKGKKVIESIEIIKPMISNAASPPPQGGVVIGEPVPAQKLPFQLGKGCPVCWPNNGNCVYCGWYDKFLPRPPP